MVQPTGGEETLSQLLIALNHPNPHVRSGAANVLGKWGDSRAIEPLIKILKDSVPAVHRSAAKSLGAIGAPAVPSLLALIQDPPFQEAPVRAGEALSWIRDPNAIDMLCAALEYPEEDARQAAAEALGEISDPIALPGLIVAVQHEDPQTRKRAGIALGKIGDPQSIIALTSLLSEENWRTREVAVRALGNIKDEGVIIPLLTMLSDNNHHVRWSAATALQNTKAPNAAETILASLPDSKGWARKVLVETLGEIGDPLAIEVLHNLTLEADDLQTQLSAAQSLVRLGDKNGKNIILRTLNAPNAHTRLMAAIALGNTGDPQAVEHLVESEAIRGEEATSIEGLRQHTRVIAALVRIGEPAVGSLIEALGNPFASVRSAASQALILIGPPAIKLLLARLRKDRNKKIKKDLIQILGNIGDKRSTRVLGDVLHNAIRPPILLRLLLTAVLDPTVELRKCATDALRLIKSPSSGLTLLESARFDLDPDVREHAGNAVAEIGDSDLVLRLAQPNILGFTYWGIVSLIYLFTFSIIVGGLMSRTGAGPMAFLAGLVIGGTFGLSDGFSAHKMTIRSVLMGTMLAFLLYPMTNLLQIEIIPFVIILIPVIGALSSWHKVSLPQRLSSLFAGMILGFVMGGIGGMLGNSFF